eukprot:Nitzschia sp. Nitz4//scaffold3_size479765//87037//91885//NITZ4_000034-RA/size479765-augustus-gene-0.7-mRNA-1//1//CDS//3329550560//1289//frame0
MSSRRRSSRGKKNNETTGTAESSKGKMRQELSDLHQEMELVSYARAASGHLVRKVPKSESLMRTRKRKLLEKMDEKEMAIIQEEDESTRTGRRRKLGALAALKAGVVERSQVFPSAQPERASDASSSDKSDDDGAAEDGGDDDDHYDFNDDNDSGPLASEEEDDDIMEKGSDGEEVNVDNEPVIAGTTPRSHKKKLSISRKSNQKRQMYRMKNFQSQKMAHRHGQALAAHARGQPWLAIEMLKKVAVKAPSAPQIYSSLGLVYEDLLKESRNRSLDARPHADAPVQVNDLLPDPRLAEQLELAKKAYGSYHIAAILCKRDYTFWVRAADAGLDAAEIHGLAMLLPSNSLELVSYHRAERERWLDEVIRDLRFANNLKPPGIDVPAKLAAVLVDMGSLLEALALLTDLKNQPAEEGRGEFRSSYKAWLLYADLMLRMGHECIQWNRGDRSNQNYMFRRWLHKYSHTFDWQKRRLQALCMALEAAAGTKNVEAFIVWMRQHSDTKPPPREGDNRWHGSSGNGDAYEQVDDTPAESLELERKMLLERHRLELESFDKTTVDMDVATNSVAALDRQQERDSLVQSHKLSVTALESDAGPNNQKSSVSDQDDVMMHFRDPLVMSASCRQVCNIASVLMKHLHGLELYRGARLVGDSVSQYMKDRAAMYDKRSGTLKQLDQNHEMAMNAPLLFHNYDKIDSDSGSDVDDVVPFLSDDEGIDEVENSGLLDSLRRGILPPEMSVLYGMSLIVEGGKNFLALKCLEAIDSLEKESSDSIARGGVETDRSGKPMWHLFRRAMTEPLGRTAAYAFLADILRKSGKEAEWSVYFAKPFREHLAELRQSGLTKELTGLRENLSPFASFRKNQLLKVVLASCRFDVDTLRESSGKPLFSKIVESPLSHADKLSIALTTLKTLTFTLNLTWKVEPNGSLPSMCLEAVKAVSKCIKWISQNGREISYSKLYDVLECGRKIASFFCGGPSIPDFKSEVGKVNLFEKEWGTLPIEASWQDASLRQLSLRVYNLTVACNVSLFSGWEADEFTLNLLRRRYGHKHFGVHLRDDHRLTGFLPDTLEAEIARQWDLLYKVLPNFPDVKFRSILQSVKKSDWYVQEVEARQTQLDGIEIARYAEDDAEATFLSISSVCLALIDSESNTGRKSKLIQTVLSILIPISQFCLDKRLWQSDIGEAASSLSSFEEWRLSNGMGVDNLLGRVQDKASKPPKKRRTPKFIERKLREWIEGTDKPTLQSFVNLPSEELTRVWLSGSASPTAEEKKDAEVQMQNVHEATRQLRACYTEVASGRASLQVAVALLRLGSMPGCLHPFVCLQQAAMFAGQSLSAGNNDSAFRDAIPDERQCTALEGLSIIGRADCLHSMYFADEAAFLCSYVARVCRLHRDREEPEMEWNQQWKVLAIYAYNVSVMIRTTVSTVLDKKSKKSFLVAWERDVVEELERGRTDGWVWKRTLFNSNGATARQEFDELDDVDVDGDDDKQDASTEIVNDGSSVESKTDERDIEDTQKVDTQNCDSLPTTLTGDGALEKTSHHVYFEIPPAIPTTAQVGNTDDTGSLDGLEVVEL